MRRPVCRSSPRTVGSRADVPVLAIQRGVFKVLPIIDWDNRTAYQYLQKHGLKYHPLWD
ncbi:phosphoadenosine phosphosulfate reductase family protein [Shigella flexneri]